ncbi:hypothetical protein BHM03_00033449 [Ensete ventricosum]|nr:hypothetical protein BHM03_00033449 [Ensete ventricosum]
MAVAPGWVRLAVSGAGTSDGFSQEPLESVAAEEDLHKGLIEMGVPDMNPPTLKSTLRLFNHRLPHEANKSASQVAKGKGPAGPTEETPTPRPKLRSVRELCSAHPGVDDRDYHAIQMSNLPKHALDAPLEIDLAPLTYRDGIWLDGEASTKFGVSVIGRITIHGETGMGVV